MPPPLREAARHRVSCRAMADADLPFVAALYASTRAAEMALTGWPEAQRAAFLAQQHEAQHRHYRSAYPGAERLILVRGDEAIGRLYLADDGDSLLIVDISLVPEAQRQGIGAAVLGDVLAAAAAEGRPVAMHVERGNPARRLYRRLGFETVGDEGVYLRLEWRSPIAG